MMIPHALRPMLRRARALLYRGRGRECPCCGRSFRRFVPAGRPRRSEAACPGCGALERHRLLALYLAQRTAIFRDRLQVLYLAPEESLQRRLGRLPNLTYVSGDLESPLAMVRLDLLALPVRTSAFDAVICSHVLEHVADVGRALAEIRRALVPGGWAILQSPFDPARERTFEDASVTSPRERERVFGQRDHLRIFGRDYPDRLRAAGFEVRVEPFARTLPPDRIRLHGIDPEEDIHLCVRPAADAPES